MPDTSPSKRHIGANGLIKQPALRETPVTYQFRVVLQDVIPMVWRRILMRSDHTIADLHNVLQVAMGWSDEHLNRFHIHGRDYGVNHTGGLGFRDDPRAVRLSDFRFRLNERFVYEYDFGDRWEHDVRLEAILPIDAKKPAPLCVAGKYAVPPEDCGGPEAYREQQYGRSLHFDEMEILRTAAKRFLEDPKQTVREAIGDMDAFEGAFNRLKEHQRFQPKGFDRRSVNARLKQLAKKGEAMPPEDLGANGN